MVNPLDTRDISQEKIAIVGAGKVGTAVGFLLRRAGYDIVAIADRNPVAVEESLPYTGGIPYASPVEAAKDALESKLAYKFENNPSLRELNFKALEIGKQMAEKALQEGGAQNA